MKLFGKYILIAVTCLVSANSAAYSCTTQDKITLAKQGYSKSEIEGMCGPSTASTAKQKASQGKKVDPRHDLYLRLAEALTSETEFQDEGTTPEYSTYRNTRSSYENGVIKVFVKWRRSRYGSTVNSGEQVTNLSVSGIDFALTNFSPINGPTIKFSCKDKGNCTSVGWYANVWYSLANEDELKRIVATLKLL